MRARQSLAVLLTAAIAVAPATVARAQDAGDEQYSDPLAGQTSSSSSTPAVTPMPSTAQAPSVSGSSGSGTSSGSAAGTTTSSSRAAARAAATPASSAGELPRTGMDTWAVAALGAALGLLGIGLRLRTADARP